MLQTTKEVRAIAAEARSVPPDPFMAASGGGGRADEDDGRSVDDDEDGGTFSNDQQLNRMTKLTRHRRRLPERPQRLIRGPPRQVAAHEHSNESMPNSTPYTLRVGSSDVELADVAHNLC